MYVFTESFILTRAFRWFCLSMSSQDHEWLTWRAQDATLKRCFGVDKKIAECDWEYLSTLKSLRAPHTGMPRLKDVLELFAEQDMEKIWLMLDIKVNSVCYPYVCMDSAAANTCRWMMMPMHCSPP